MSALFDSAPTMSRPASAAAPNRPTASARLADGLLWLLLALLTFSLPQKPLLELDSSWRQALAYFFQRGYPFGQDVVFTYGPLGFLLGNTYTGLYFGAYVAFQIGFAALTASLVMYVGRALTGLARFAYFAFFILWGVGYPDALHMIVIAFSGWILLQPTTAESPRRSAMAAKLGAARAPLFGALLAFLAVIKFTNLLFAGFVAAVVVMHAWLRRDRRDAGALAGAFGGGFLGLWAVCGQPLGALPAYVRNSLDVSSGYQAAMGLPTPDGQLTVALSVFAALGAYMLWNLVTQPDRLRAAAQLLILAAFLFLNWKHGFVRADGHMLGFFYCALVPAVAFPVLFGDTAGRWRWLPRTLLVIAAFLSLTGMRRTFSSNIDYAPNITNEKLQHNLQALFNWGQFRQDLQGQVDHWHREAKLPKTQRLIGHATVDVLGFEQAIALFNDFNYTPRPVFQSYSVYTPRLAQLNADFLASARAPEFLLLKLQTIDERPALLDDSRLMALFPHLYEFQLLEKDFYVFRRRAAAPPVSTLQPRRLRTLDLKPGEALSLAEFGADPIWLEIDLPFSLRGKVRNFLYKPPFVHLRVVDAEDKVETYRLPLTSARAGFQINPLVVDFPSYLEAHGGAARQVKSITLEVDPADRNDFAPTALVGLSALQPVPLKAEFEKQLEREKFSLFSALPLEFFAHTTPSEIEIDGREALVMHAPSLMEFAFPAGTSRIHGAHGYPPGAYTDGGGTDGALFTITWTDGTETRELYRRELQPLENPADRGLIDFDLDTTGLPAGRVRFEVGIRSNPGWDWTAWAGITIE